ncbi:MAG: FxLYD domain-containing protein [Nitrososphaera sp.]
MKAAALAVAALVAVCVVVVPLAADAQSPKERLSFYPEVPTEKSPVTARVSLAAPTPCYGAEVQGFEKSGNEISINVKVTPPSPETACAQVLKEHLLEKDIGALQAGAYTARLYVNGEQKATTKLYVTGRDVAVLSTGRYVDYQGDSDLIGEVRNDGSAPVGRVAVDVNFFQGETLFREERVYTTMGTLMPNMTSGFSLLLAGDLRDKEYSVRVTSYDAAPARQGALRLEVEPQPDRGIVTGTVYNDSIDQNATQVKIACVLYDPQGVAVDSVFDYSKPATVAPGKSAGFEILANHDAGKFTASCNSESVEFAAGAVQVVPEFPAAVLVLAGSLACLAVVYRFRNNNL